MTLNELFKEHYKTMTSRHLQPLVQPVVLTEIVNQLIKLIPTKVHDFDAIAVSGNSGVIVGSVLSVLLDKPLIIVRKENEQSHGVVVEMGLVKEKLTYIIVDDLICSGGTINRIFQKIDIKMEAISCHEDKTFKATCRAIFLTEQAYHTSHPYNDSWVPVYSILKG